MSDFDEHRYYKNARLLQLSIIRGKLLAGFQIGEKLEDMCFCWSVSADGQEVKYIDNRGERDIQLPPPMILNGLKPAGKISFMAGMHVNILDTLFMDTLNGDLTVKVEDNTRRFWYFSRGCRR